EVGPGVSGRGEGREPERVGGVAAAVGPDLGGVAAQHAAEHVPFFVDVVVDAVDFVELGINVGRLGLIVVGELTADVGKRHEVQDGRAELIEAALRNNVAGEGRTACVGV